MDAAERLLARFASFTAVPRPSGSKPKSNGVPMPLEDVDGPSV
jgi:hypothetical protein